MAARIRKPHQDDHRFYVYKFIDEDGKIAYVGKGSGRRFSVQFSRMDMTGDIISWHAKEADAYKEEKKQIALLSPYLNKHPGGNGSNATKVTKSKKTEFERLCEKIGTKAVAARICLNYWWMLDKSKIEIVRSVAYG